MKCKKCRSSMQKKLAAANKYYFECPHCHETVGKPTKESESNAKEEVKEEITEI